MPNTYEDQPPIRRPSVARPGTSASHEYARRIDCAESGRTRPDTAYGLGRGAPYPDARGQLRRAG